MIKLELVEHRCNDTLLFWNLRQVLKLSIKIRIELSLIIEE
mgnify:CR=1 FL=1